MSLRPACPGTEIARAPPLTTRARSSRSRVPRGKRSSRPTSSCAEGQAQRCTAPAGSSMQTGHSSVVLSVEEVEEKLSSSRATTILLASASISVRSDEATNAKPLTSGSWSRGPNLAPSLLLYFFLILRSPVRAIDAHSARAGAAAFGRRFMPMCESTADIRGALTPLSTERTARCQASSTDFTVVDNARVKCCRPLSASSAFFNCFFSALYGNAGTLVWDSSSTHASSHSLANFIPAMPAPTAATRVSTVFAPAPRAQTG